MRTSWVQLGVVHWGGRSREHVGTVHHEEHVAFAVTKQTGVVNTGPQCTVSIVLRPRLQPIGMVLFSPWVDLPNLPSSLETPS